MTKREKVIKALECCLNPDVICTECPYFEETIPGIMDGGTMETCGHKRKRDALALLREQGAVEPKIVQSEDFLWSHWYICGACEYPVDPGDKFCRKCGRELKWDD